MGIGRVCIWKGSSVHAWEEGRCVYREEMEYACTGRRCVYMEATNVHG